MDKILNNDLYPILFNDGGRGNSGLAPEMLQLYAPPADGVIGVEAAEFE